MKINFQKLISVVIAVCVMCCFAISVSADTSTDINGGITSGGGGNGGSRSDYGNALEAYLNSLGDYIDGDITIDDFLTTSNKIISESDMYDRMGLKLMEDITDGVIRTVEAFGDNAAYYLNKWYQDFLDDYIALSDIESPNNPDMKGYSSALWVNSNTNYYTIYYSSQPGYIKNGYWQIWANEVYQYKHSDGTQNGYSSFLPPDYPNGYIFNVDFSTEVKLYGTWLDVNGDEAETDEEYIQEEVLDFSDVSDDNLEELLKDLLDKLNLEMPDLSTIEGLLTSIYNRLGTLDSDNDNELLSQVLVAIQNIEKTDNSDLLAVLNEIKDELTNGTTGDNSDLSEKLENMITVEDFTIDEEAYKNNSEILKLRLQEKFIFADQLKDLVTYSVNSYKNSDETPDIHIKHDGWFYSMNFDIYEEYMPTIRFMIAAFTYISYAFHTYRKIPSYINGGDNE